MSFLEQVQNQFPLKPAGVRQLPTKEGDPRIGTLLGKTLRVDQAPRTVLIGFPCDAGVRVNGGRPGAVDGPDAIRRILVKFTPDAEAPEKSGALIGQSLDLGNLQPEGELEQRQQVLGNLVAACLKEGCIPIILGGGHETAYGHFLGYAELNRDVSIINIDAHADVRPLKEGRAHSGSPFFQALTHESKLCKSYTVAGLFPQATAAAHVEFLKTHKCHLKWSHQLTVKNAAVLYSNDKNRAVMATFDLDVIDQAFAPGVSAPAVAGIHPEIFLAAAHAAGSSAQVSSFDIVELNPKYDIDDHTARLAALAVWRFLQGISNRPS